MTQLNDVLACIDGENRVQRVPSTLPVLPMRDMIIYPYVIQPLCIGREKSRQALEAAMTEERHILLLAQHEPTKDDPTAEDLFTVGTVAECLQLLRLPDDTIRITVEGIARVKVRQFLKEEPYFEIVGEILPEVEATGLEVEALIRSVLALFEECIHLGNRIPIEALENVRNMAEPGRLADTIASYLSLTVEQKQQILETIPTQE
ncbi:MAG TPA: LON peptidase substrate-binding domain-containing protein, partial [Armatimonadota bacterium]